MGYKTKENKKSPKQPKINRRDSILFLDSIFLSSTNNSYF